MDKVVLSLIYGALSAVAVIGIIYLALYLFDRQTGRTSACGSCGGKKSVKIVKQGIETGRKQILNTVIKTDRVKVHNPDGPEGVDTVERQEQMRVTRVTYKNVYRCDKCKKESESFYDKDIGGWS
jgi:hypothetical protein